ncbi:MAG: TolC family protein [Bacteroidetes bacterium]|nr:TolC family protein [Bacteroidota bacterium]
MISQLRFWITLGMTAMLAMPSSFAQEAVTESLSLEEAVDRTMKGNRQIRVADYEYQSAQSDVNKMKSYYLPQVDATVTGSASNLPLNAFGMKLNHGAIEQTDFIPSSLNNPSSITNLQSQFMIKQPIMNLDARSMKNAMVARSEAYGQQIERTKEHLEFEVTKAYLQLQLTYEVVDVLEKAMETAQANLKLAEDNLEAGYIQKADVLSVELRINEIENQLFEARSNILNASDQLSFMMGSSYGTAYTPSDTLSDSDASAILADGLPMNRSDIMAMEYQVSAQESMLESAKKAKLPRINAFGSYEVNNPLDFADAAHGYVVAVQASWNIFNGNKNRSAVQKAKIDLDKTSTGLEQMIAQSELELEVAKRKMVDARNKIDLSESAIGQSNEFLRIKTDRYEEGLEKTTDILMAETDVAQKEMNYIEAVYHYQLAHAQIKLLLEQ